MALFERNLAAVNPSATVLKVSARSGNGIDSWLTWLDEQVTSPARG